MRKIVLDSQNDSGPMERTDAFEPGATPRGERLSEPVTLEKLIAQPPAEVKARPIERAVRIPSVDCIRGFAVLGILLMNIVGLGMYGAAYIDPTVAGGASGANLWTWIVMHVLADGKMRCLFSLIFGASVILLTSRLESRRDAADIYYRRTIWLLLFGIVHAYLLWWGDILYEYALCGLVLYPFRNNRPKRLLIIGGILLVMNAGVYLGGAFAERDMIHKGLAAQQAVQQGKKLTDQQEEDKAQYEQWHRLMRPTASQLKRDADNWRGNPLQVIKARANIVLTFFHTGPYYSPSNLDCWCMMFIGMGLLKLGVLSAKRSYKFYAILLLTGYGIGLPINCYTAWVIVQSHFDPVVYAFTDSLLDPGRFLVAAGHLSLVMLIFKAQWFKGLMRSLGAVGETAFTNYILQSLIASVVFTGYGFRLYDRLQRYQLYYVVAGIWLTQMIASPIWLRYFQFGPLEWCWRSLTYWRRQPMRVRAEV